MVRPVSAGRDVIAYGALTCRFRPPVPGRPQSTVDPCPRPPPEATPASVSLTTRLGVWTKPCRRSSHNLCERAEHSSWRLQGFVLPGPVTELDALLDLRPET